MTTTTSTAYTRALGARLLGEANDLKRTPESLASELNVPFSRIQAAIAGELEPRDYRELFELAARHYPISFGRFWIESTDADAGVRHVTAAESKASSRVFTRKDRSGTLTPYYEYRDTAMSRLSPFRPEWIREIRVVGDNDPDNPDVAYNKGHFLHQTTFFIGPVNFYWEANGKRYCAEMSTGDSNYITPFFPHSFTSRDASQTALILAVTYGGEVARARDEAGRMGPEMLRRTAVELRDEQQAYAGLLKRHVENESLTPAAFAERCVRHGIAENRAAAFLSGQAIPTAAELQMMADALAVTPRDLMPPTRRSDEEIIIVRRAEALAHEYPGDDGWPCYRFERLARSRHQPYLKSFVLNVLPGRRGSELRVPLHQYVYNHGDQPVILEVQSADGHRELTLEPGDSAYTTPMTGCRFSAVTDRAAEIYIVRVPGDLHADAVFELSGMAPSGWSRVAGETTRWF